VGWLLFIRERVGSPPRKSKTPTSHEAGVNATD
jgi:hypothetical protein